MGIREMLAGTTLTDHLRDATAVFVAQTPIFAALELCSGMSDEVSMVARTYAGAATYTIITPLLKLGRRHWQDAWHVGPDASEARRGSHDATFLILCNGALSPLLYLLSGSRDYSEIATATLLSCAFTIPYGYLAGYLIDTYKDLFGKERSPRLPECVAQQGTAVKRAIGIGLIGLSLGATGALYMLTPAERPAKTIAHPEYFTAVEQNSAVDAR